MIDKLVIQIPFSNSVVIGRAETSQEWQACPWTRKGVFQVPFDRLPFPKGARFLDTDDDGNLLAEDIYCPWESLETSHSGLAIKPFHQGNGKLAWPYLEIKCSPAKLVQGHNVFGTDHVRPCVTNMLHVLAMHYPGINEILNMADARVSEFDITYSVAVPFEVHRRALMDVLRHVSKGQTKNRGDSYESSVYFGSKNSRLKKVKVYLKGPEILADIDKRKRKGLSVPPGEVVAIARDLVRFELTIKKDWLERRLYPTNLGAFMGYFDPQSGSTEAIRRVYNEGCKDLFDAMCGEVMTVSDDQDVMERLEQVHGDTRGRPARLMGFYQSLKAVGYDALKRQHTKATFYRYVSDLEAAGYNRAHLCSLHDNKGNTVISFPTLVTVQALTDYAPDGYEYPELAKAS